MRRLSTQCPLAVAWLWLGWPQPHLHAPCTAPAVGATCAGRTWNTFTQLNDDYFDLERGSGRTAIAAVAPFAYADSTDNIQRYSYLDRSLVAGGYCYRLRQVDFAEE